MPWPRGFTSVQPGGVRSISPGISNTTNACGGGKQLAQPGKEHRRHVRNDVVGRIDEHEVRQRVGRRHRERVGLPYLHSGRVASEAFADGGEIPTQAGRPPRGFFRATPPPPPAPRRAATERLQPVGSAPREQIKKPRSGHIAAEAGKRRLSHAVGRGADGISLRNYERNAAGLAAGDAHGKRGLFLQEETEETEDNG